MNINLVITVTVEIVSVFVTVTVATVKLSFYKRRPQLYCEVPFLRER